MLTYIPPLSQNRIPHIHVDLPPLVSVEATRVSTPNGGSKILLAAVSKSPNPAWIDDIIELLNFTDKSILAGDLKATYPFWNSSVSNSSGWKLLDLYDAKIFEISVSQCRILYCHVGNGDVLDTVVDWSIRLTEV
jgi:hypothetical protein